MDKTNPTEMEEYRYIEDEATDTVWKVNQITGEATEVRKIYVEPGSIVLPPGYMKEKKRLKEKQRREGEKKIKQKLENNFIFISNNIDFSDISAASVTRLLYLSTYMRYDNTLMKTKKTPIRKEDLSNILGFSNPTVNSFMKEVIPKFIVEQEDGTYVMDREMFLKGTIEKSKNHSYRKFFIDGLRFLYQSTYTGCHKHIGYVLRMFPFANIKYNMLCYNIYCNDIFQVKIMPLEKFCDSVGLSNKNIRRLKLLYETLTFNIDGRREYLCKFAKGTNDQDEMICINPNILYSGNQYTEAMDLGGFIY